MERALATAPIKAEESRLRIVIFSDLMQMEVSQIAERLERE
jgi:hypothetical protein